MGRGGSLTFSEGPKVFQEMLERNKVDRLAMNEKVAGTMYICVVVENTGVLHVKPLAITQSIVDEIRGWPAVEDWEEKLKKMVLNDGNHLKRLGLLSSIQGPSST